MRLKNTFVQGKMNRDIDERLLPKGQYPSAENIRVSNTDGSDAGAVENVKGNELLSDLGLTNAKTIGAFADGFNELLYWFVTSDEKDLVLEYNNRNNSITPLLESTNPEGVLNFNRDFLITGVNKIINDKSDEDLLLWTDDLNAPRKINIERSKTYGLDGFIEDDISVIKKPPRFAPTSILTFIDNGGENGIEDRFISFAYRYRYLDGEYSALSSFTNYNFSPSPFDLNFQTMENEGMLNSFNAIRVEFDTGDERVTDIQLVAKESNSNNVSIIETFNKEVLSYEDNTTEDFLFSEIKQYVQLPEDEIFRVFDNVPLRAKAQEIIGNRLVYGNYVEGYDLVDVTGNPVELDYELSINSSRIGGEELPVNVVAFNNALGNMSVSLSGIDLSQGSRLVLDISAEGGTTGGFYSQELTFIFLRDYNSVSDLVDSDEFTDFIERVVLTNFRENFSNTPPNNTTAIESVSGFVLQTPNPTTILISSPLITYEITDPTTGVITFESEPWNFINDRLSATISSNISDASLKSNRSYEVGIIYLDEYGRASTVLTAPNNTIRIPSILSDSVNKIQATIKHKPPVWADRYKLVVQENRGEYQTIYTNVFFEDGVFRWILLEAANVQKVSAGDTLIVKSDLGGTTEELIRTRVIEISQQEENFLSNNTNLEGEDIIEPAGLYMRIRPEGFDMTAGVGVFQNFEGTSHERNRVRTFTQPSFDMPITAGSSITIDIRMRAKGSIAFDEEYNRSFVATDNYASVRDWFFAEVGNLGQFGRDFTWDGVVEDTSDLFVEGLNQGDADNQFSGWGFSDAGDQFFVTPFRRGTVSRSITTSVSFSIRASEGIVIFETEAPVLDTNIFYETEQTFEVVEGRHLGNIQNQESSQDAIIEMDYFNAFPQGNGAESNRVLDAFNRPFLNIDLRPSATSVEEYREIRRYADLTYSAVYNENTNTNGLNEFNLSRANFKEDIDKRYGFIQKIFARDTDLILFQEDKVSRVLFEKDLLQNADGTSNISSIEEVLGQQIAYAGEWGISRNPESFAFDGFNLYFTDVKRGAVMRLNTSNGLSEISYNGMTNFFRTLYRGRTNQQHFGGYDPFYDQYIIYDSDEVTVSYDEKVKGFTSLHSFRPDFMIGMNNEFFTFNNGELYIHNSGNVPRNTYYGIQYPSRVSVMINDSSSEIKELQAVSLEGNYPWDTSINAYVDDVDNAISSSIREIEYVQKEGIWYAYARRNEDTEHLDSKSVYGIGRVMSSTGNSIVVLGGSTLLCSGDTLITESLETLGIINEVSIEGDQTTIVLSNSPLNINEGTFLLGRKDPRIEGGNLRGYTMRFDLEITQPDKVELFAVNGEVAKSFS